MKSIGDIGLSGVDYISVAVKYLEAINQGAIPKIEDSWTAVIESQLTNGYNVAMKIYEDDMKNFESQYIPCNEEELEQAHRNIMQAAMDAFLEITKGFDNNQKQEKYDELQGNLENIYDEYKNMNAIENKSKLNQIISSEYRTQIQSKDYKSIEEYLEAWKTFKDHFIEENTSYKKYEVWSDFSLDNIQNGIAKIQKKMGLKSDLKEKKLEIEVQNLNKEVESVSQLGFYLNSDTYCV